MKCRNHFVKKGFLQHYTPTSIIRIRMGGGIFL